MNFLLAEWVEHENAEHPVQPGDDLGVDDGPGPQLSGERIL